MRRAASMENDKTRILVRFRPEISECFELQAIYEGLRVGTIANRVLREEIEKVSRAGKGHIITRDSAEFEEYETAGDGSDPVYVLPNAKEVIAYMPDQARKRGTKVANNKQISFYLTDDEIKVLNEVVYAQDIRITMDYGEIVTYRFAILALLLNAPELARREPIAWR